MADVFMIDGVPGEEIIDLQFAANVVKEKLPARAWRRLGPIPTDPVLEEKLSRVEYDDGYVGPGD